MSCRFNSDVNVVVVIDSSAPEDYSWRATVLTLSVSADKALELRVRCAFAVTTKQPAHP
jgi:hypothetical protein